MKKIFEKLFKEKLLGWFLILWGISYLMNSISVIIYYFAEPGKSMAYLTAIYKTTTILSYLINPIVSFAIGIILVLLGYKLIKQNLSKEKLLGYLLILFGVSYLIGGIVMILAYLASIGEIVAYIGSIILPLFLMAMGLILVLLGRKVIKY